MAESANWMDTDAPTPGDLNVLFYRGFKRDVFASQLAGHPIEAGVDYVKISHPGERDNTIMELRELSQAQRQKWGTQLRAYLDGRTVVASGTPLDLLFPGNPEIVATLKGSNVHTIEQLANYPDSSSLQFAPTWKQKAQQYLSGKQDNRFPELERQAAEARAETASLKQQMAELMARMATQPVQVAEIATDVEVANIVPERRGPGRPPKIQEEA